MIKLFLAATLLAAAATVPAQSSVSHQWGTPAAAAIPTARGYVSIQNAAITPDKKRTYRAIYNSSLGAREPSQLVPALNMAGGALNAFAATGTPLRNARIVIVIQGAAVDGIIGDVHYKAKHGIANPNLEVLSALKKAGVQIFVCGQTLVRDNIDIKIISPDVTVASAAQIVLMQYQNDGYALLSY